jgi:NitT/TauT family transport system substrate-binding protein
MSQGAKVVFDFASYMGPFCNTGIMVLQDYAKANPDVVQALVSAFEEASRLTYAKPDFAKEVARKEFPDLPPAVADKAIDMQLEFKIPAQSVKTDPKQWENLIKMQIYLKNVKGTIPFKDIIDNSYADKAIKSVK